MKNLLLILSVIMLPGCQFIKASSSQDYIHEGYVYVNSTKDPLQAEASAAMKCRVAVDNYTSDYRNKVEGGPYEGMVEFISKSERGMKYKCNMVLTSVLTDKFISLESKAKSNDATEQDKKAVKDFLKVNPRFGAIDQKYSSSIVVGSDGSVSGVSSGGGTTCFTHGSGGMITTNCY